MIKVGFIINPIAGMGGSVALKGTDGDEILKKALELGAKPKASEKATLALKELLPLKDKIEILTASKDMGENVALNLGFKTKVVFQNDITTKSYDTIEAAKSILTNEANLLLFAGGDGTARDIYNSIGYSIPVIGIPAGVKIHSPVYAVNPSKAGILALNYIENKTKYLKEVEVLDINEDLLRNNIVNTKLYGYLKIPYKKDFTQNKKSPTPLSEETSQKTIALYVIDNMEKDVYYLIGPGSTTKVVMNTLHLPNTLLGVDIIKNKKIIKNDASEKEILEIIKNQNAKLIITPTGGQGYLLGRGNQQISKDVIKEITKENIIVISTLSKIQSLNFEHLNIDTGDKDTDNLLRGYLRIIIGYKDEIMYPVS